MRGAAVGLLAFVLAAPIASPAAVEGELEVVVFQPGDTIRGVAERYLKDPDLWPQILELSGIGSAAELEPGTALRVPVIQVAAADDALAVSLAAIQRATAQGARIFAPVEIGAAIENRDSAVEHRHVGAWAEVVTYAGIATGHAERALEISLAERDRAAEAVISDAHGTVEGRAPEQPRWSSRELQDVLVEFERVRTLSASTAQVTFRDLSRLRLNPNSNAIIQRMRSDPLTGDEVTKVSLVNGDFYALLNQLGSRSGFEVEVPGLDTSTRSSDFWVKHEGDESRFANYDAPPLEITRGAETISLGENEGAVVPAAGAAERTEVLARAELESPFDGAQIYDSAVELRWRPAQAAEGYWIEVAADADFNVMQASEWGVRDVARRLEGLEPGTHFWRVSALDRLGLPGVRSLSRRFTLLRDDTPPFLTIVTPAEGEIVTTADITIEGESEPGARVLVNGTYVPVTEIGRFTATVKASLGENAVRVEVVDPAGNRTERRRSFVYRPGGLVAITLDPALPRDSDGRLLSRAAAIDIGGTAGAEPGQALRVVAANGQVAVQTLVGEAGRFDFTVPATEAGSDYRIEIVGPTGRVEGTGAFTARQDAVAPEIRLDAPLPAATADAWIEIAGTAEAAVAVTVNGAAARLTDGRFDAVASLAPGPNGIEIVATDAVGNVAVSRLETTYDIDPPEIGSVSLGRPAGEAGPIEIVVEATDQSGLRQAAPFILSIGGAELRGFLRCDSAAGACRESLPPQRGTLRLIEVSVADYAGNVAKRQE